jgi:tRNA-specific 2-thiouridylase
VREQARAYDLGIATKPDSQEICFIPGGDYKRFIDAYLDEQGEMVPDSSGELVTTGDTIAGHHDGIHQFTVGQRKGLRVASPSPLYVLSIDPASRRVTIGSEDELLTRTLIARQLNWIAVADLTEPMRVRIKIRHRHEPALATIEKTAADEVTATFDERVRAVTPGQAAVFYQDDVVVGGGWIIAGH